MSNIIGAPPPEVSASAPVTGAARTQNKRARATSRQASVCDWPSRSHQLLVLALASTSPKEQTMCFGGGRPLRPHKIKYQGPSKDDIRRQEQELERFQQQIADQQANQPPSKHPEQQIDKANQTDG